MDVIVLQIAHHKEFVTGCLSPPQACLLPYIPVSLSVEIIFCLHLASPSSSVFQSNLLKKIKNSLCTLIHDDLYLYHPNFFCLDHRLEALQFHNQVTILFCFPQPGGIFLFNRRKLGQKVGHLTFNYYYFFTFN